VSIARKISEVFRDLQILIDVTCLFLGKGGKICLTCELRRTKGEVWKGKGGSVNPSEITTNVKSESCCLYCAELPSLMSSGQ
jgi:hypothetical protein